VNSSQNLERGLGLKEATAVNMIDMVGIGPFIVIPFVIQYLPGRQSLLAWAAGAVLALFDGCVWAELGAAMPQAGGSYVYLREEFGAKRWGRLMSFLLIWQTLIQAPLVMASGAIGFAQYLTYIHPMGALQQKAVAGATVVFVILLLYRRIATIGKISMLMWVGVVGTMAWLIWGGMTHFNLGLFDAGSSAGGAVGAAGGESWLSIVFLAALGHATVQTVYTYLGYYNVANVGGEVRQPEKNIPRTIFISIFLIALLYLAMQTSILGVVPWEVAKQSPFIVSTFVQMTYGAHWASLATGLILFVAFCSLFSATLGYSRIPYAAALDGNFFSVFSRLHPEKKFPYVSLLVLGVVALIFSLLFRLRFVISAILAMRCLIQFIGQSIGLLLLRRRWPAEKFPFKMWLYPAPVLIALLGWMAIFVSTGWQLMVTAFVFLGLGIAIYGVRARMLRQWPFEEARA
jgi:fructoselysine transporter